MDRILRRRQYNRSRATRLVNLVNEDLPNMDEHSVQANLESLVSIKDCLKEMSEEVLTACIDAGYSSDQIEEVMKEDFNYETNLLSSISKLKKRISSNSNPTNDNQNRLKLPKVPLPTYGNYPEENLNKFKRSFESIILKHKLTSYENFIYLKNQLHGGPRTLVDSLDVESQSYEKAMELLEDAFGNADYAKFDIIRNWKELKLPKNIEPYKYIGDVKSIISEFSHLKINIDDILQHFIWNSLNEGFQNVFIAITNKSNPNFTEIKDNLFEAAKRYERLINKQKTDVTRKIHTTEKPENSSTMAVNIKQEKKYTCMLCK